MMAIQDPQNCMKHRWRTIWKKLPQAQIIINHITRDLKNIPTRNDNT